MGKIYAISGKAIDKLRQENTIRKAIGDLEIVELGEGAMIRLNKNTLALTAASGTGHTGQLLAVTVPAGASVSWSSSAEGKATVSNKGLVTGVAAGSTTITASITVGGTTYSDICNVTVT